MVSSEFNWAASIDQSVSFHRVVKVVDSPLVKIIGIPVVSGYHRDDETGMAIDA